MYAFETTIQPLEFNVTLSFEILIHLLTGRGLDSSHTSDKQVHGDY